MTMEREQRPIGPGMLTPDRARRLMKVIHLVVAFLVGGLAGSATFKGEETEPAEPLWAERVLFDLYLKETARSNPQFIGTTSIAVAPGEEFRVECELGREAILSFCAPGDEANPCGGEGPTPERESDREGEYKVRPPPRPRGRSL